MPIQSNRPRAVIGNGQGYLDMKILGTSLCLLLRQTVCAWPHASLQVRQPLYNSSVSRWRRYESHLGPLRAALGGTVEQYEARLAAALERRRQAAREREEEEDRGATQGTGAAAGSEQAGQKEGSGTGAREAGAGVVDVGAEQGNLGGEESVGEMTSHFGLDEPPPVAATLGLDGLRGLSEVSRGEGLGVDSVDSPQAGDDGLEPGLGKEEL